MADADQPFAQEGYELMGAAFEVHNVLGGGLSEEIYQQSLEIELGMRDIPYQKKQQLTICYKGRELEKKYIPDLFVYQRMVVELKSVDVISPAHEAQIIN